MFPPGKFAFAPATGNVMTPAGWADQTGIMLEQAADDDEVRVVQVAGAEVGINFTYLKKDDLVRLAHTILANPSLNPASFHDEDGFDHLRTDLKSDVDVATYDWHDYMWISKPANREQAMASIAFLSRWLLSKEVSDGPG